MNEAPGRGKLLKLLLIDLGDSFGGVERYVVNLTHLLRASADVYVLCALPELAQRLDAAAVQSIVLPRFRGMVKPLRFAAAMILMPFLLLKYRIEVVQVNGLFESFLMVPARLFGRRTVSTRHGPFELEVYRWYRNPLKFLPRAIARLSVHFATEVVCVSQTVGVEIAAVRPRLPVTVIPNWVSRHRAALSLRPGSDSALAIVCAGRLEEYKGFQLVIEAIREIEGVRLTIVGDGPYRKELEQLSQNQPVVFRGFQNDMQTYYEAADVFVMPSIGPEGMPMSSLEAMGWGLPCIFSDLPVHREISEQGAGALLFRSGDVEALRSALRTLVADAPMRSRLATSAYRIVQERYTEDVVRPAYLRVFGSKSS